ncbi:MAG: SPFH domain-containing protein [Flavobacteriaceae bacterium]
MGLFDRTGKGRTFDGKESERKGFIDRIIWETEKGEITYKFPYDNLTTGAVLIVREHQKAFFFKDGVMYDSFGPGRHTLETANIPFLHKALDIATGGDSSFIAEVWFVSTELAKRNMPWGIGGLEIVDPYVGVLVKLGARGQYGFKISDPEILIKKMVGSSHTFTTNELYEQFEGDVIEGVKNDLADFIKKEKLSIGDLARSQKDIANHIKQNLDVTFMEYGVELLNFNIKGIEIDKKDEAYKTAMEGIAAGAAAKRRREILGDAYTQERQLDIMEQAAKNEGMAGAAMGAGMGAGMGLGMGNMVGNMMTNVQGNPQQSGAPQPPGAVPPPVATIYTTQNGQTLGPYSIQQINEFVTQNTVTKDSLVWKQGMQNWVAAATLPELQPLFQQSNTPPPPPPPVK